ncbi:response regulator transcription factor [Mumia sp. zg.B53]|uniref:response regulator transcription factor n=1 Tax=unclassified Mumia TaxID=2621872 RepID=UPI001C6F18B3|nr:MULTISPECIES: response regulator transcription factor [unclassified Mumia]MBW9210399.1 response regulator transcription factor [Mumia sp. zg.B21]MBW9215021.1 response regulator transcription factor [Mumia sp. zg.B53]
MTPDETPARLLVVDDDESILDLLASSLRFAGFTVDTATDGQKALEMVAADPTIDLVVLDVMMPHVDGFEVIRRLRADRRDVPVIFLTARDTPADRVNGLTAGGDDYLAKPFSLDELVARVRAVLRRTRRRQTPDSLLRMADLEMDTDSHEVRKGGELVELSPTEFKLLRYLLMNPGRVLSKQQILDHVWNYDFGGDGNVVETYISYLRRKLDTTEPHLIHTVRGVGYVLRRPR